MQIPILQGIYVDSTPDFRTRYPFNLIPVPKPQGLSEGYLRPAEGIEEAGTGPGICRGVIRWKDTLYAVMGSKFVSIPNPAAGNQALVLGDVEDGGPVTFDYSFDYLAIASNNNFYLYDGSSLERADDPDIGNLKDFAWIDGYFMLSDGEHLAVTELDNPRIVNPLKYGSSEADPDPIVAVLRLRNEIHAINRFTIEVFANVGSSGFPFSRNEGAQVQRGCISTHACCVFMDQVAFLGGGRDESPSVWLAANGHSSKIATREIDQILGDFSEAELENVTLESRSDEGHQFLYVHLSNQTLVFDGAASSVLGQPVWIDLGSGNNSPSLYLARNFVWCYGKWMTTHPTENKYGFLSKSVSTHYAATTHWNFETAIIYNEGYGVRFKSLELEVICFTNSIIKTQFSIDGFNWSSVVPFLFKRGSQHGARRRAKWLQQGIMRNWRVQRFFGTSDSQMSIARLEADVEPLER